MFRVDRIKLIGFIKSKYRTAGSVWLSDKQQKFFLIINFLSISVFCACLGQTYTKKKKKSIAVYLKFI